MCCLVPMRGFCCSKQEFLNPSGMQNQMEKKKISLTIYTMI